MSTKNKFILASWLCALLLFCLSSEAPACGTGWFGSNCQYKCRCTNNSCDNRGQCTPGYTCEKGWFGPACQYADLASENEGNYWRIITDGDDRTCITSKPQSVTVTLDDSYHFTWLRVHLKQSDFLDDLTVTFNSSLSCTNPRNSSVDDTTLDIYCDLNQRVQTVSLTGEGVQDLCSVYVSGGRNVALKQSTSQSSTYWETIKGTNISFTSDKAVDGDTSGEFIKDRYPCTHTSVSDTGPNWTVRFSKPQRVNRYTLYNRNSVSDNRERIRGFILESFSASGDTVFSYTDRASLAQRIYKISSENVTSPVSRVMIKKDVPTFLAICELEIYGDSVCDSGHYGRECEHKCNCARNEACFVSTGGCPSGCPDGFHGENCNKSCEVNTWGERCSYKCSQFCDTPTDLKESLCDNVDGRCKHGCQSGYRKPMCTEACEPDKYGPDCQLNCNEHCLKFVGDTRSCDHVTGACLRGCVTGYEGQHCTSPCRPGKYGLHCQSTCSDICVPANNSLQSSCHHISGTCLHGCLPGYSGPICPEATSKTETSAGVCTCYCRSSHYNPCRRDNSQQDNHLFNQDFIPAI